MSTVMDRWVSASETTNRGVSSHHRSPTLLPYCLTTEDLLLSPSKIPLVAHISLCIISNSSPGTPPMNRDGHVRYLVNIVGGVRLEMILCMCHRTKINTPRRIFVTIRMRFLAGNEIFFDLGPTRLNCDMLTAVIRPVARPLWWHA